MRSNTMRKDLDFYLNLHYPVTVHPDPESGFVAEIDELPGCMTQGETLEEVFEAIEDARHGWIQAAYDDGQDIPLPRDAEEYSGKILVRIPRSLHRTLAHAAKQEGVSLNQYIASLLAAGVQRDATFSQVWSLSQPPITKPIFWQLYELYREQPQIADRLTRALYELFKEKETATSISSLTPRESEILSYIAQGYLNKQIAEVLGVTEQTIKDHISSIVRKLNVNARTQAVIAAVKKGGVR